MKQTSTAVHRTTVGAGVTSNWRRLCLHSPRLQVSEFCQADGRWLLRPSSPRSLLQSPLLPMLLHCFFLPSSAAIIWIQCVDRAVHAARLTAPTPADDTTGYRLLKCDLWLSHSILNDILIVPFILHTDTHKQCFLIRRAHRFSPLSSLLAISSHRHHLIVSPFQPSTEVILLLFFIAILCDNFALCASACSTWQCTVIQCSSV